MREKTGNILAFLLLVCLFTNAQRVGIGTTNPLARLAVDSGILIDQLNLNESNLLAGALVFGSDGKVGIGRSTLAGSGARSGIGFFTSNQRRVVIDSVGRVGIGISQPAQRLHVEGNAYINGNLGVGVFNPIWDLHIANSGRIGGYFGINIDPDFSNRLLVNGDAFFIASNVGINISPSSTYSLYASGSIRFTNDLRIDGILNPNNPLAIGNNVSIDGSLSVGGRGIVRGSGASQWRLVRMTVAYSGAVSANSDVVGAALAFNLGGGTLAGVFVGPIVETGAGASNLASLGLVPTDISNTGCRFLITNGSVTAAQMGTNDSPTRWQLTMLVYD